MRKEVSPTASAPGVTRYDAFVSYAHSADAQLAPRLHSALEGYAKPWYRLRALRVFHDGSDLSAAPGLWVEIEKALSTARWFILLASPAAAASPWCTRECAWWLANRPVDRLLVVLTEGEIAWQRETGRCDAERTTALPKVMVDALTQEPLFVDVRWARHEPALSLDNLRWRSVVLDLAAPLHGLSKSAMDGEAVRAHRRNRRWAAGTGALLALLATTAAVAAYIAHAQTLEAVERGRAAKRAALVAAARAFPDDPTRAGALIRETTQALAKWQPSARILQGHTQPIRTLAFSADGKHLVTGADDRTARIWPTRGWGDPVVLTGHSAAVRAAVFDTQGARVLTGSEDQTVRVWPLPTGAEPVVLQGLDEAVVSVQWADDGASVVAAAWRLLDLQLFASSDEAGASVVKWPLDPASAPTAFGERADKVVGAAFSADGRQVALAAKDHAVSIWRTDIPSAPVRLRGPSSAIDALAINGDGTRVAAGARDGRIHVWRTDGSGAVQVLTGHDLGVTALAFVRVARNC